MNVVSAVSNMQQELNYYKEMAQEQKAIIKQLIDGPGDVEYIHPFDLSGIMAAAPGGVFIDVVVPPESSVDRSIIHMGDKKYRQSVNIPAKCSPDFIK